MDSGELAASQSASGAEMRAKRRLIASVKDSLRDLRSQLSVVNHHVGTRLDLRDADLECLDLLARYGPLSPSALARHAGLHPATLTGILDRLERGRWVVRERNPADRRAVVIRALRDRGAEVFRLYAGMNAALDEICGGYQEAELELLAGFLRRVTEAGQHAASDLTS